MAAALPWFLFAHVLSALWFAAGVLTAPVVLARTRRAGSLAERVFGLRLAWRLVAGFSIPGAVVSGLLGVHLIETRGYSWQAGWVHASLWIWGVVLLATALLLAPWLHGALREAEASLEAGRDGAAANQLGAFVNELKAQGGKGVDARAARALAADALWVSDLLR